MPYTYKNDKPVNTEMFKFPDKYGRTVNLNNWVMRAELENYQREIGEKVGFALGDPQFEEFERVAARKHKKELIIFLNSYGGLESAERTFKAASKPSKLITYIIKQVRENEKSKSVVSTPRKDIREGTISA